MAAPLGRAVPASPPANKGRKPTPKSLEPNKILVVIGIILMLGALFIAFGIPALGAVDIISIPSWSAAACAAPAIGVGILSCWVFKKAGPDIKDQGLYDARGKLKKMKEEDSDKKETQSVLDKLGIDDPTLPRAPKFKEPKKQKKSAKIEELDE